MLICRFKHGDTQARVGLVSGPGTVLDLTSAGVVSLFDLLEQNDPAGWLNRLDLTPLRRHRADEVAWLAPVERQEIWAAGVTYLRSKTARMSESNFSATAYDRVYEAERPELFFKSLPEKVRGPGQSVGIRSDSRWSVPEPELALVINTQGRIVGYTLGNDLSARDIEGENLLYLPQAKIFRGSCALGPAIKLGVDESQVRDWSIELRVQRAHQVVFSGQTTINRVRRPFSELAQYLFRCQEFPHGAILLTGTGIVPPDDFTLQPDDIVEIETLAIGQLRNQVGQV
jgi:2-dehydro-3-deoxy-D-arabinonate dehydratase